MPDFSTAPTPSYITLPRQDHPYPSLLDFFDRHFPKVGRETWKARLEAGKITDDNRQPMTLDTPYQPHLRLRYYREVEQEPDIPFEETILFRNDHILVVDKPHFIPVTPAGLYVNQCLLYRLKAKTGIEDLVPVHRIDRETAGLVMFSVQKETRGVYHELFSSGKARKVYEAIATLPNEQVGARTSCPHRGGGQDARAPKSTGLWEIRSRIVRGEPWFRVKNVEGKVNAVTRIRLVERCGEYGYFQLEPKTGKQHQLRLHLTLIGSQILYDRYYPELQPKRPDDYSKPLQLLAKELHFTDPITRQEMKFCSKQHLILTNFSPSLTNS